jgi:ATP-dependent DNA helicase RecG
MRPEVLNPLFAEVETLKGVGPNIAKSLARLDLTRAIDLVYHLPTGTIDRIRASGASQALLGRIVVLDVTPVDVRAGSGRAPLRIYARDGDDNTLTLTFFNNPAWAKKQLPLHEKRTVIGKLDAWGQEWQIVHPEVIEPAKAGEIAIREPVYGLTEGISNKRMRELALAGLERAPELPEGIEPSLLARQNWPAWHAALAEIHSEPSADNARKRLSYDEIFANQLALMLLRQVARRKRGVPLQGDGRLTGKLQLPYRLTGAQQRVIGEIRGDMAQDKPMLRLLQGDVGSGKTLAALLAMLEAVEAGAQSAMLAPTEASISSSAPTPSSSSTLPTSASA